MPEPVTRCPLCPSTLLGVGRIKHHADGTHTFVPFTPPKSVALIDRKPRPRG